MKQIAFAAAACLLAASASAQVNVVKDAERAMKGGAPLAEVVNMITPAFTNPETAKSAQTYYVPGKAAFNEFDQMLVARQLGQGGDQLPVQMGRDLLDGYAFFMKAFPLDSLPDEKGKIKPKYSKDMANVLAGHYMDYNNAAIDFWGAQDFQGAYDAWTVLLEMPKHPAILKALPPERQFPDSTLSELAFNRGLAAWQVKKYDDALNAFQQAKNMGYNKKQLYDYAIGCAAEGGKDDAKVAWSKAALPIFGHEDDTYIRQIINDQLQKGEFDQAKSSINAAIAEDPNNSQYQWVLGIIYDFRKDELRHQLANEENISADDPRVKEVEQLHADARTAYEKAVALNAQNASAWSSLGRIAYEDAQVASNAAPINAPQSYYAENIDPLLRKSADYFEKALAINPEDHDSLVSLRTIYYNLNDSANLQRIEQLLDE